MVDDRTPHLNLPLPFIDNPMTFDVPRLREAFGTLDVKAQSSDDLHALFSDALQAIDQRLDALEAVVPGEESQTLTEGQTVVDVTTMDNLDGAAVFIEGVRLTKSGWTRDPVVATRLTLSKTYPAGHEITVVR